MNKKIILVLLATLPLGHAWAQQVLTLQECRDIALENNKKMKAAHLETEAAKAGLKSVEANAYPSLDGSLTGVYLGEPLGGGLNGLIPEIMGSGSLTASLPIYAGGKIRNGKAAAAKGVEISQEQLNTTTADVLLNVEKAYWQVVQLNEKVILADKYKVMLQSLHKDLKNSFDAGLIYKNDLLRVEVNLNEAELNIKKAEDGLVMSKLNLAQVAGFEGAPDFVLADSVSGSFDAKASGQWDNVADNRPEIKTLQKAIEAQELQRKLLKGDQLPTVGLAAIGLAAAGKGVNISDGSNFMGTYVGLLSVNIPIFDWGKKSNKAKEQSFKIAAQQQRLEEARQMITLEVQYSYLQLNQSSKNVELSRLSLEQASENLRLAEDRLRAGTIVGKDVLEAQAIWQQAYNSLIDAEVEYKINEATYKKALGELH